jgi:hypothetical protein
MNDLEIPLVNELPAELTPLRVLPYLLSRLLEHDEALLHAENRRDGQPLVTWHVRPRADGRERRIGRSRSCRRGCSAHWLRESLCRPKWTINAAAPARSCSRRTASDSIAKSSSPATAIPDTGSGCIRERWDNRVTSIRLSPAITPVQPASRFSTPSFRRGHC